MLRRAKAHWVGISGCPIRRHGPATPHSRSKNSSITSMKAEGNQISECPTKFFTCCFRRPLRFERRRGCEVSGRDETRDQPRWGSRRAARPAAAWRRRWYRTPMAPPPPSVSAAIMAPSVLSPLRPPTQTPRFALPQYAPLFLSVSP